MEKNDIFQLVDEDNFYAKMMHLEPPTIDDITERLEDVGVPQKKIDEVKQSFEIADKVHAGVMRDSGEAYITHPLQVAEILLDMGIIDPNVISGGILHDTVEDAPKEMNFTTDKIAESINSDVASLVDGVTNLSRLEYYPPNVTNEEMKRRLHEANNRKLTLSMITDIRVIHIKYADRIHNLSTLEGKKGGPDKKIKKARETREILVPTSKIIGAYQVNNVLSDLSLRYTDPEMYQFIVEKKKERNDLEAKRLEKISYYISEELNKSGIPHRILRREKSISTIYEQLKKGCVIDYIDDLFYLKVVVQDRESCYRALDKIHGLYVPVNGTFKDYIGNPRTDGYKSLHTTVFNDEDRVKVKIRDEAMNLIAALGLSAYLILPEGSKTLEEIQEIIGSKAFAREIDKINHTYVGDTDFNKALQERVLTDHVYVYFQGETIELPMGYTVQDFLNYLGLESDNIKAFINAKLASLSQVLQNTDHIILEEKGKVLKRGSIK